MLGGNGRDSSVVILVPAVGLWALPLASSVAWAAELVSDAMLRSQNELSDKCRVDVTSLRVVAIPSVYPYP